MNPRLFAASIIICFAVLLGPGLEADEGEPSAANPLADFERLIGGQWRLEGSYQEFEWGIGKRSVRGSNYFIVNGEPRLVSEGMWYWHPGDEMIKGVFAARDMPVDLFDYTTQFEGNRMVSELVSFGTHGDRTEYVETWEFTDDTHFTWTLFRKTPDGLEKEMGGVYTRSD